MTRDAAQILADLARHARAFDLADDAGGRPLGERLCVVFTDGVAATIAAEEDPDGNRWPDLSPAYQEQKARQFPGKPMGVRLGLMADPAEVAGEPTVVGPDSAFVTYGVSAQARDEAAAFAEGDPAANRPPRPFWGFTAASTAATEQLLADRLRAIVG